MKTFVVGCFAKSFLVKVFSLYFNRVVLVSGFFEERAILLGRLGRHEQALAIYVYVLRDNQMAKE